ncbi:MAG: tetratricopeptide repeat protein [Bauldia sp.]
MRISNALNAAAFVVALGLAGPVAAFEAKQLTADTPPSEALRFGLDSYKSGDTAAAIEALNFAAEKGLPGAQWKLGRMYAIGDGVERDEYRAFELFSAVANAHADDGPGAPTAAYVSNAFVQLGTYYRQGIPNSKVTADLGRARHFFAYAASYFGDSAAQLNLARMYYAGEGGDRDLIQAAKWASLSAADGNPEAKGLLVGISLDISRSHLDRAGPAYDVRQATRWARRAADYGSVEGQALFGHLLFEGDGVSRQPVEGLMYLTIALARAGPDADWIRQMHENARSVATEAEWDAAKQRADEWLAKNPGPLASNLAQ